MLVASAPGWHILGEDWRGWYKRSFKVATKSNARHDAGIIKLAKVDQNHEIKAQLIERRPQYEPVHPHPIMSDSAPRHTAGATRHQQG
jgi:hypothetical protein